MASRRNRRPGADPFSVDVTPREADALIYGELDALDRARPITRPVELDELIVDERIQVRVAGLNEEAVERYMQVLLNGGTFDDPIVCFDNGAGLIVADGFHRCEAYRRAAFHDETPVTLPPLRGIVHPGGVEAVLDQAVEYAETANLTHGQFLTPDDRRNILYRRLERRYWGDDVPSNRELGRLFAVHHTTVGRWIDDYVTQGGAYAPLRETHGKAKKASKRQKRAPTTLQLQQRILRDLARVADAFDALDRSAPADEVRGYREHWEDVFGL